MHLRLFVRFWIVGLVLSLATACRNDSSVTPTPPNLLVKTVETRYSLTQQLLPILSSHPPVLFQGTTYYYTVQVETSYQYDTQGRLLRQTQVDVNFPNSLGGTESNWYSYVGNQVIHRRSIVGGQDTLTLNEYGYAIDNFFLHNKTIYTYDQDGYLLHKQTPSQRIIQTIEQGNLTKQVDQEVYSTSITNYEYNHDRANLVDPRALFAEGKGSRNLLTKVRTAMSSSLTPTDTTLISTNYSYEFDERNRVKQQTSLTTNTSMSTALTLKTFTYSD